MKLSLGILKCLGRASAIPRLLRVERALSESEKRFRQITENIRDVFWLTNPEKTVMHYVSPAYETIWGQSCADLYARPKSWIESIHPADRTRVSRNAHENQTSGRFDETYRIVRPDGGVRWIHDRAFPVFDGYGHVHRIAGIAEDITERVVSERRRAMEHAVTRVLGAAESVESAVPSLIQQICSAMDWAYGAYWAWDAEKQQLSRAAYWSAFAPDFEPEDQEYWLNLRGGGSGGLLRRAWLDRDFTWREDLMDDPSFRRKASCRKFGLRSGYCFPVLSGSDVIGAMEFFGRDVWPPDEALLKITHSIGLQIGQFIERRRAEAALRESEQRFAAIFEHAGAGIAIRPAHDRNLPWLQVNDAFCRMLGYTRDELLRLSTADITVPEDAPAAVADNRRLIAGEIRHYTREKRLRRKDGTVIWVSLSVAALPDGQGRARNLIAVYQDISERRRLECDARRKARIAGLLESLARAANEAGAPEEAMRVCLAHLQEYSGWTLARLGIYVHEADRRVPDHSVWQGDGLEKYCGFINRKSEDGRFLPDGRLLSKVLTDRTYVWIDDIARLSQRPGRMADALAHGLRSAFAFPVLVDGKVVAFLEFFGTEPRQPDGDLIAASGSIAGQLARLIEKEHAQAANRQLAAIVRAAEDAVISCRLDGRIETWNAGAEKLFGYTAEEAIGQSNAILYPDEEKGRFEENFLRAVQSPEARRYEAVRCARDGRRIEVAVTAFPIRSSDGNAVAVGVIYHDITARKALMREAQHKARLTAFLESLARAANEAGNPDEAMRECLERICEFGGWVLGSVGTFAEGQESGEPHSRCWHARDPARFGVFIRASEGLDHFQTPGRFVGRVLREKEPVWICDIGELTGPRMESASQAGLRSAFAFPVTVQGKIAAFLEFYADDTRPPDQLLLETVGTVSAQLGRLIERQRAYDAARASQDKLERILGSLREVLYSCDYHTFAPTYLNAAAERISGYRIADFEADPLLWFDMIHPADQSHVKAALALLKAEGSHSAEYRIVRRDGEIRHVQNSAQVVCDASGNPLRIDGVVMDITERRLAEERADHLARFDALTDLPNRVLLHNRLDLAMAQARRRGEVLGVMVLNVDRFKKVNDSLGIHTGDDLLRRIARRLQSSLREVDTIARMGGNEFAVLVEGVKSPDDAMAVGRKLVDALALPFDADGREIYISASVGIAVYPDGASGPHALIQNAEAAMRRVKAEGGNDCQFYDERRAPQRLGQLELEGRLRHALERGELVVHYQPKVGLLTGAVAGAEALVRWNSPELGAVSPGQFIPLAEETGLIVPIGEWVLRTACADFARLRAAGHDLDVAVNLSPRQFRQRNLVEAVAAALRASGLDPDHLILEITEGTAMSRVEHTVKVLNELRALGVKLAVDDFGTGYSSLSYLKRFPLHSLKIDRSFVVDIGKDPHSEAIVPATIALAHSLKLKVVAEGVETAHQRDFLASAGCDQAQGFLYAGALPATEFSTLLGRTAGAGLPLNTRDT